MSEADCCLVTKDYAGNKVVFTEKQRALKAARRPELLEEGIIERIKTAIEKPTFIYPDFEHTERLVYYLYEYKINGRCRYVKVVVDPTENPFFIVTAYRPDYVKERGKTQLIYGTDSE